VEFVSWCSARKLAPHQEKFADRAGLQRTHVSLLERGKRNPTLEVIKKIADALKTTMASLMEELEADGGREAADAPVSGALAERKKGGRAKKSG
jgi:transcriptional regulator with XRE-family HTH domain